MLLTSLIFAGSAVATFKSLKKKKKQKLSPIKRAFNKPAAQIDKSIQGFMQKRVDPLFNTSIRNSQVSEFKSNIDEDEKKTNRQVALSGAMTIAAGAGSLGVPALSMLSIIGTTVVLVPIIKRYIIASLREKKLKYRVVTGTVCLAGTFAGYYLATSILTFYYVILLKISARVKASTYGAMHNTFSLEPPKKVWIVVDNIETEIDFDQVQIGDVLVLEAGQTIPVDGVIIEGEGTVDQHTLTGESQAIEKSCKDSVLANTLLVRGKLFIQVEKAGNDTSAAQISDMLLKASAAKMKVADRSEKFADKIIAPLALASTTALFTLGSSSALAILNGPFGGTAVVAGPLCMISFLNIASQKGILIKDGLALENLHQVNAIVFDKTGTLTLEQPIVSKIYTTNSSFSENEVLRFAAIAEHRQTHPIAKAILAKAEALNIDTTVPDSTEYTIGMGISIKHDEDFIHVGSIRFLTEKNINIPEKLDSSYKTSDGSSWVFVAVNNSCIGALCLQAQLRPGTLELIQALKTRNISTYILSGDAESPTKHLANQLNIDGYYAEVLPNQKAEVIESLQNQGKTVCFVGDGINDALALKQADISVSMRGATSLATDSAQIVLMNQSLQPIISLFDLGKAFNRTLERTLAIGNNTGFALVGGVFLFGFAMPAALAFYIFGMGAAITNALLPMRALNTSHNHPKQLNVTSEND